MKVYYMIRNNGDGSASPLFFETEILADLEEEWEIANFGEGWGESSVGSFEGCCFSAQRAIDSYQYKVAELEYYKGETKYDELAKILAKIEDLI